MTQPFDVTDDSFEGKVLQAAEPTLVDFWAEWCAPCKRIGPVVEEVAEEYGDRLQVAKVNVDANPGTLQRFGIMGIPTLILFKDGTEVARIKGYRSKESLVEELLSRLPSFE